MKDNKDDIKVKKIMHSLSLKNNIPFEEYKSLVNSPYEFTKETIKNKNYSNIETEEDFEKEDLNFIYTYIGKIYTTLKRIKSKNKRYDRTREYK